MIPSTATNTIEVLGIMFSSYAVGRRHGRDAEREREGYRRYRQSPTDPRVPRPDDHEGSTR